MSKVRKNITTSLYEEDFRWFERLQLIFERENRHPMTNTEILKECMKSYIDRYGDFVDDEEDPFIFSHPAFKTKKDVDKIVDVIHNEVKNYGGFSIHHFLSSMMLFTYGYFSRSVYEQQADKIEKKYGDLRKCGWIEGKNTNNLLIDICKEDESNPKSLWCIKLKRPIRLPDKPIRGLL